MIEHRTVEAILELARWAPSGDNTQCWRFEIGAGGELTVHGFDTRTHCVYDLDGHPSQISLGALLETIAIAASTRHLRTEVARRTGMPDERPTFDIRFIADPAVVADPLAEHIVTRSVQRRPMRMRAITAHEKAALASAVGPAWRVVWFESLAERWRLARLMFANAKLRLTMPEAYATHREIIEWGARESARKVPDQALGVDPMTLRLMRWIMADWRRVAFFNRWLAGTVAPRLQMDLLPGLACAAHFALVAAAPPRTTDDYVAGGRVVQRFWLAATRLGLAMQPELTPLIFARYVREGRRFSAVPGLHEQAAVLAQRLEAVLGAGDAAAALFIGRIGAGPPASARSTRRPLAELMINAGG
ncbi:MAG TPA: molybdopterin biosynthesis protein MoeY [Burkholderiaceae bacterium]|nr:molybdopterin biosynthesis protein MoeY [Burkholderiaceae bacterium]